MKVHRRAGERFDVLAPDGSVAATVVVRWTRGGTACLQVCPAAGYAVSAAFGDTGRNREAQKAAVRAAWSDVPAREGG